MWIFDACYAKMSPSTFRRIYHPPDPKPVYQIPVPVAPELFFKWNANLSACSEPIKDLFRQLFID
jgi:hypothetical protein